MVKVGDWGEGCGDVGFGEVVCWSIVKYVEGVLCGEIGECFGEECEVFVREVKVFE